MKLLRAGAPADAIDYLQGHVIGGALGSYIVPLVAFDLGETVGLVPQIGDGNRRPRGNG